MPWSNQGGGGGPWGGGGGNGSGGGGGGKSPWGGRGPSGGGQQPPDIDEVIRQGQARLKRLLPSGMGGPTGITLIVIGLLALWLFSGLYRVQPNQQGIELVFGRFTGVPTEPGLHWNYPSPIGSVIKPDVTRENRVEVGYRSSGDGSGRSSVTRDVPEESQMITGDENIVDIDFVVFWRIADAGDFLFNLQDPAETVKMAAESAMRDAIGKRPIQVALTEGRQLIESTVQEDLQSLLTEYGAGVSVRQVQLLAVDPPKQVIDAFNEVQRARQDKDRLKNEAETFRNDVVPRARGEAAQMIEEADAFRQEVTNRAIGDADRFESVYKAYSAAKEVTQKRIYLETMEEVLGNVNKIIIDSGSGDGNGVIPYLPLPEVQKQIQKNRTSTGATQ
ncbi:FtsH protease activity modulator HflK [uncultured Nisaea sp.]|jgi:modulator of FtsH protease HflK|uniref:FtsH protease activity modulator HflK n=1 Tax=uncultured Nisaea sp. TaxID=538215 RepID=UPI0030EB56F2|tara:strand:- start:2880 stop:4049 length:1170 start_codon:yes stop_codon:yes gene_type:complete